MLVLLNCLLTTVGGAGIVWYMSSTSEFWPALAYFMSLFAAGLVSAAARYIRSDAFLIVVVGVNGVSVVVLVALLIAAFVVSSGSGVAALPFLFVPLAINVVSFNRVRAGLPKAEY